MGWIGQDGVYHKEGKPDMRVQQNSTWKQHDHKRQRNDNAREIIQPYDRNGRPSQAFIDAYPEESREYGFLPTDDQLKEL